LLPSDLFLQILAISPSWYVAAIGFEAFAAQENDIEEVYLSRFHFSLFACFGHGIAIDDSSTMAIQVTVPFGLFTTNLGVNFFHL